MFEEICVSQAVEDFQIEFNGKTYEFAKKPLTWAQLNEYQGKACVMTQEGKDKQTVMRVAKRQYVEDCLVAMLVKTPWPIQETRVMLRKLDPKFGELLEKHVPDISGPSKVTDQDFFDENSAEQPVPEPGCTQP